MFLLACKSERTELLPVDQEIKCKQCFLFDSSSPFVSKSHLDANGAIPSVNNVQYNEKNNAAQSLLLSLLKSILFPFIKQICLCASKVHNFRTSISIFFLYRAFFTVVGI